MCQSRLVDWRSSSAAISFFFFGFGASNFVVLCVSGFLSSMRLYPSSTPPHSCRRSVLVMILVLALFFFWASLYAVVAEQSALHLQRTRPVVRAAGIMISKVHFPKSCRKSRNRVGTKELDWADFADPARVHGR